ncbi:MAG: hypothetical protein H6713_22285 [Myxococcales bacterium]|nr:hypothetical protein [Myxococcales bacterium]MCB9752692.1 hypothetical protein [Myxococcales bacterium]
MLLWVGVLLTSFVSVREAASIDWLLYGVTAAVGVAGVVLLRLTAGVGASEADKLRAGIDAMRASLTALRERLTGIEERRQTLDVYEIKDRIDEQLAPELASFADAREAMIPSFGMQGYADVMTRFAGAERMINRAWSASADGYVDEVWICLERASGLLDEARARFTELETPKR